VRKGRRAAAREGQDSRVAGPFCLCLLHQPDLLLRQAVQLIDQPVDLPVRGLDAAGEQSPLVLRAGEDRALCRSSMDCASFVMLVAGDRIEWGDEVRRGRNEMHIDLNK